MIDVQTINTTINIIGAIIGSTGFSAIIVQCFKFLKQIGVDKKIKNVDTLVHKAINFASQKGFNLSLDNDKMYDVALAWVKNEASKNGIKYSDDEWEGFIESTYKMLKNDWNEASKNSALKPSNISSDTIVPSDSSVSLQTSNFANSDNSMSGSVVTVGIQNTEINKLAVPEDMLNGVYTAILEKSNQEAKNAINVVIDTVNKSITEGK